MLASPSARPRSFAHVRTQESPPHLIVELDGRITGSTIRHAFNTFPALLAALPSRFVTLATYPDVTLFAPDAVGQLFSIVARLFDAEPGLCVFVDGGKSPHPGLRDFITRVGTESRLLFVPTIADALDHIRADGSLPPPQIQLAR